jgi:hypothetical protein
VRSPNRILPVLLLGIAVVTAAGCGGGNTSADSATSTSTAPREASESFTRANYGVLASEPSKHKGARVDIVAKVFRVERDEDGTYLQVWADSKNSEWNTIVGVTDPKLDVAEDDYVRILGTVKGEYEGENAFGAKLTLPLVLADSVKKADALAVRRADGRRCPRRRALPRGATARCPGRRAGCA